MSFYDTTKEPKEDVKKYRKTTEKQDVLVLRWCQSVEKFTPWSIHALMQNTTVGGILITSVRRSINTLLNDGKIEKTGFKRMGPQGRNEFEYKIKE